MCDTCYFISTVFEAASKYKLDAYMPVLMLLRELEKQKRIVLLAGDCPIEEVAFQLGEERHYTIRHYFKCITHSRLSNDRFFLIGACIRGFPSFQVLDTLEYQNLPDVPLFDTPVSNRVLSPSYPSGAECFSPVSDMGLLRKPYVGYCRSEKILTRIMALGFAITAMQICDSEYILSPSMGLIGLSPAVSNVVHSIGAVTGFGAMFIWIAFFFTRGVKNPTPEKLIRNQIYLICATLMACGIILFLLGMFGVLGKYNVFIAEEFLLIPAGFALLVKSGSLFRDQSN